MTAFERRVTMRPAFDRRDPDPQKNYGIHGVEMRMVLRGPEGAVQFVVYTNWNLPHVRTELARKAARGGSKYVDDATRIELSFCPMGADVGYHWPTPQYEGQEPQSGECEYLDGKTCYYDGSSLAAEAMLETLIREGDEAVWSSLEARYHDLAGSAPSTPGGPTP